MSDKSNSGTKTTGRSPAYPLFGLKTAIERLGKLYNVQRANAVSVEAAMETLGYNNPKSGYAQRTIAALISYGLLAEEGSGPSRRVRVTELGRKLLLLPEDDEDRKELLRTAATSPKIYKELLERYPESLPSDGELRKYLTFERGYNEESVRSLIEEFRETYQFAKLGVDDKGTQPDKIKPDRETPIDANSEVNVIAHPQPKVWDAPAAFPPATPDTRHLTIPITQSRVAILQLPGIITEYDFEFLQVYLLLMKDAIINGRVSDTTRLTTVQSGPAIWHAKDADYPVKVTGYAGEQNSQHYVTIDGSNTGIPMNEIEYDDAQEN